MTFLLKFSDNFAFLRVSASVNFHKHGSLGRGGCDANVFSRWQHARITKFLRVLGTVSGTASSVFLQAENSRKINRAMY
jgi:hypothetical protein